MYFTKYLSKTITFIVVQMCFGTVRDRRFRKSQKKILYDGLGYIAHQNKGIC